MTKNYQEKKKKIKKLEKQVNMLFGCCLHRCAMFVTSAKNQEEQKQQAI